MFHYKKKIFFKIHPSELTFMEVTITRHALSNGVIPRQSSTRYWGYSWVIIYYILGVLLGHHILYIRGTLGSSYTIY